MTRRKIPGGSAKKGSNSCRNPPSGFSNALAAVQKELSGTTGDDTSFAAPNTLFVKIDTKNRLYKGTSIKKSEADSTNTDLMYMTAEETAKLIKKSLATEVGTEMVIGALTANKLKIGEIDTDSTTAGDPLTFKVFTGMNKAMTNAGIPRGERYFACNGEYEEQILNLEDDNGNKVFISKDILGAEAIKEGIVGKVAGFKIISMTDLPLVDSLGAINATSSGNIKNVGLFYTKVSAAYGTDGQIFENTQFDQATASWHVYMEMYYGAKVTHGKYTWAVRDN